MFSSSAVFFVEKSWKIFISLRLTFILLVIISVGSFLGMSYDQTVSYEEFLQQSKDLFSKKIIFAFELYDAFHSWWFALAVILLAANLIACSIERLPRIYIDEKFKRPYLTKRRFSGLRLKKEILVADIKSANSLVNNFFLNKKAKLYFVAGNKFFFKPINSYARFGVYVVHISLLIIMFSTTKGSMSGLDSHVFVGEGAKTRFVKAKGLSGISYYHDLGFYIGCDDFRLKTFIDNSPMAYESDLSISKLKGSELKKQTIRVNQPLSYAGFTFYQSSYRLMPGEEKISLAIYKGQEHFKNISLKLGEKFSLPDGTSIMPDKSYEDFAGLGQALRIKEEDNNKESSYFHIFRKAASYDRIIRPANYNLVLVDFDHKYETGLSITEVPGIEIIFFGFALLLVGVYMCFFINPLRCFARIKTEGRSFRVYLAMQGFKNPSATAKDFALRIKKTFLKK